MQLKNFHEEKEFAYLNCQGTQKKKKIIFFFFFFIRFFNFNKMFLLISQHFDSFPKKHQRIFQLR